MNKISLGIALGTVSPIIFFFLYFIFRFQNTDFVSFIKFLVESEKMVHVMSLSVVPNLAPFFFFVNSSRFLSAKGVLGATITFAIIIFIIKLF